MPEAPLQEPIKATVETPRQTSSQDQKNVAEQHHEEALSAVESSIRGFFTDSTGISQNLSTNIRGIRESSRTLLQARETSSDIRAAVGTNLPQLAQVVEEIDGVVGRELNDLNSRFSGEPLTNARRNALDLITRTSKKWVDGKYLETYMAELRKVSGLPPGEGRTQEFLRLRGELLDILTTVKDESGTQHGSSSSYRQDREQRRSNSYSLRYENANQLIDAVRQKNPMLHKLLLDKIVLLRSQTDGFYSATDSQAQEIPIQWSQLESAVDNLGYGLVEIFESLDKPASTSPKQS